MPPSKQRSCNMKCLKRSQVAHMADNTTPKHVSSPDGVPYGGIYDLCHVLRTMERQQGSFAWIRESCSVLAAIVTLTSGGCQSMSSSGRQQPNFDFSEIISSIQVYSYTNRGTTGHYRLANRSLQLLQELADSGSRCLSTDA